MQKTGYKYKTRSGPNVSPQETSYKDQTSNKYNGPNTSPQETGYKDRKSFDQNTIQVKRSLHREIGALAAHLISKKYPEKWERPKLPEYKGTSDPEVHIVKNLANMEDVTDRKDLW